MKIGILAIGTRGDVQPCVALAKYMIENSYDVIIGANSKYKSLVEENNVKFLEIPGDPSQNWKSESEIDTAKFNIWDELDKLAKNWIEISIQNFKEVDAILYTPLCFIGSSIAEKLNVPYFPIIFEPSISTKYFMSPYSPINFNKIKCLNKLSYFIGDQTFWQPMRKRINRIRKEILGINLLPFSGPYKLMAKNKIPFLCAYSNYLLPKPKDWNENITVTGYWFLENTKNFILASELSDYLDNKNKSILLDLGSFSHDAIISKIQMILDEVSSLGLPILAYLGKINQDKLNLPKDIFLLDSSIPHSVVLSGVNAIITHGGVGVVHTAMKAGIPIIPIPFFGAQYFWAKRLYDLQLGSKPTMIKKLSKGDCISSINYIFKNSQIKINAFEMSQKIRTENSSISALNVIKKFV